MYGPNCSHRVSISRLRVLRGLRTVDQEMKVVVPLHVGIHVAALQCFADGFVDLLELSQPLRIDEWQRPDGRLGLQKLAASEQIVESLRGHWGMMILRFERISTAPSAASRLSASRTGVD